MAVIFQYRRRENSTTWRTLTVTSDLVPLVRPTGDPPIQYVSSRIGLSALSQSVIWLTDNWNGSGWAACFCMLVFGASGEYTIRDNVTYNTYTRTLDKKNSNETNFAYVKTYDSIPLSVEVYDVKTQRYDPPYVEVLQNPYNIPIVGTLEEYVEALNNGYNPITWSTVPSVTGHGKTNNLARVKDESINEGKPISNLQASNFLALPNAARVLTLANDGFSLGR